MARKASDISGWVFIGIGFVVIAVSIFFYNTLKFFIVIGGIMTLYGLGKLAYDKVEKQFKTDDKEWEPLDLNKAKNPYIEKMEQEKRNAQMQQRPMTQQGAQQTQQQQIQHQMQRPAHQISGRYCANCGSQIAPHHRFCTQCGARTN
ncbi:hypothetical protein HZA99_06600 [Candidatus Woesearchaeota archaeon]|nr:hypothetical protein [Candidatus Woesearchaeota archaeon]